MPLERMHHMTPTARMPVMDSVVRTLTMFFAVKKVGDRMDISTTIKIRTTQMEF